jgi:serine/threonine protein kinase
MDSSQTDLAADLPTEKVALTEIGGTTPTGVTGSDLSSTTERELPDTHDATTNLMSSVDLARVLRKLRSAPPRTEEAEHRARGKPVDTLVEQAETVVHPNPEAAAAALLRASRDSPVPDSIKPGASHPRRIAGYKIVGVIASGAMGVVYRAEHPDRRLSVAIKAVHGKLQHNAEIISRFFAESIATGRVEHPNIVRFYDFGYDANGSAYLVMELLEGETLRQRLDRQRKLPIAVAIDIASQIAHGLHAAHDRGVIHRDLKPDNIFLCFDPGAPDDVTVKLIDFGIAKIQGQGAMLTHQGDLLGTPAYMAPEQGRAASQSDGRSDLYSLGCVLFEMVCGVVPYPGSVVETLVAHQTAERPPARALNPDVSNALDAIIDALLAREPEKRPKTGGNVASALRELDATSVRLRRAPAPQRRDEVGLTTTFRQLPPTMIALVCVSLIAVVLAALLVRASL